jgi:transposase
LHLAFELSQEEWKLAFTTGLGQQARIRSVQARDLTAVSREIGLAKKRFSLAEAVVVASCYEAGRDGFWLHRWLTSLGVSNVILDSASIEVNRKKRRAKSDRLDASALVRLLVRYRQGEDKVCSVVHVPEEQAGTRDQQGGQQKAAAIVGGIGLVLGPSSAGLSVEPLVRAAFSQ